ncbi:NUDIX hydrolase [Streptomyces abyssomicinicus]|uniref:NUDIX hydrolase n=1 Tax=Streptomyces abyssomicinicus TaxID=574929 RepID=UPI00124FD6AA|nr:NUDIX hydrolase [Streptomyces abyssomicinicus]
MTTTDSDSNSDETILAAGCVLYRRAPSGDLEVCLVHRPKYDDWSFPKGKLDPGETPEQAAVREVAEETGHHVRLGPRLPTVRYTVGDRPKRVDYWAAETASPDTFTPTHEVDALHWHPAPTAHQHLTHPHDHPLLTTFLSLPL